MHLHLLRIIHLEISIKNISLVLSCESHPKCKLKATDNCIKRTLRKVNNPCTRRYKHRCFIPSGNNTSPSLMFQSLKLDIRGLNPQSSITLSVTQARQQKLQRCLDHVRHLTRSRKWKQKEGRRTSHSYWSWTHGPRGTTHRTSGRCPWRWRGSRRWFLVPEGCRGSFSWQPRS